MNGAIEHEVIDSAEDFYIAELHNKYTGYMLFNTIIFIHNLMNRYIKITETHLKDNKKIFHEALDTTLSNEKYFVSTEDCIKYADDSKHHY